MASKAVEVAHISVKVSPDTKEFRRLLKDDLDEIEKSVKVKIDVEPEMGDFREEVKAKTKNLKTKVKVDADVDKGFFASIANKIKGLDGPGFGSGVNPAGYAVILAGVLALAAPLVGIITTALLAIPGLIALVAAPIGALILGMDGLKKAAEVLKEPLDDLKKTLSEKTQEQFTPVFEKLKDIFPVLKANLPAVTKGLADMAQSIVNTLTSPEGSDKIAKTIQNVGAALSQAAPGVGKFTDGLLTLAEKLSEKFPGLVDFFNNAADSFKNFIDKISSNGDLDKAFDGLGKVLKILADAIGGIAKGGLDFMSDPKKVQDFADGLKQVADTLVTIVDLSAKVGSGLKNVIPSFDVEGIKADLAAPFTSADAPWRGYWESLKSAASEAWNAVISIVSNSLATVYNTVTNLGGTLSSTWNGVVSSAQSAWNTVASVVAGAWEAVKGAVAAGIAAVVGFVAQLPGKISAALGSLGGLLVAAGKAAMDGLLSGIKAGAEAVYNFVSGIASKIAALKGPLPYDKKVLIPNGEALMDGLDTGLNNGLQDVLATAKEMADKISKAITDGTDVSAALSGYSADDLKKSTAALEEQRKLLKVKKDQLPTTDKAGRKDLQNQIDQVQAQKDALAYSKDRLKNEKDLGSTGSDDPFVKAAAGLAKAPVDFAQATGKQFLSDIGIGGNGLISKLLTEGSKYIFNIGSVDEAMSLKDRTESKEALAVTGRK